jgi:hypothetical protein
MVEKINAYKILVGKPEGKRPLRRTKTCGWIILKWLLDRFGVVWTGLIWHKIGTSSELL